MTAFIGPMISAGASLLGGWMNSKATEKQNEQALAWGREQYANQKEFAQQGIKWKVNDAKRAGIHPLYALGAQTTSYSPVTVGNTADTSMGSAIAAAGQDISRAALAGSTDKERVSAYEKTLQSLSLEREQLNNQLLRSQIAKTNAQLPPPVPEIGPFSHPEGKPEERQPLMLWGKRVQTSPGTSPAKAWEDVLGDDVMSPGFLPNAVAMIRENFKNMSFIDILKMIDHGTSIPAPPRRSADVPRNYWAY